MRGRFCAIALDGIAAIRPNASKPEQGIGRAMVASWEREDNERSQPRFRNGDMG